MSKPSALGATSWAVWILAARACLLLLGLVSASNIALTSVTYQTQFGSAFNVPSGLIATDKGFNVSSTAGSQSGTLCPANPVNFGLTPGTANTTITSGHWVYEVRINSTSSAPILSTFNVTLMLGTTTYGPLCIRTLVTVSNNQIIDCRFDIGPSLPNSPYTFKVTIQ